jgi:drug/metabolite transporter (DMT)-like permease
MSMTVMIIVLLAATLHATWNFLVKNTGDKYISMSAVVIGHTPFALAAILYSPMPTVESLPYLLIGALLHVGYQLFLLASYRIGDLSQVYPLARGIAPLIVAGVSVLVLGVRLSLPELVGIIIIGTGITSLTLVRRNDGQRNGRAVFFSLMTGGCIAAYSLVDGIGAREAGTALGFYGWLSLINGLVFAAIMRVMRPGIVSKVIRDKRQLVLKGGGASFFAYAMIIWAFTMAPIALVTALRETSIIIAMLLGVFVLKERLDLAKVMSTALTLLGMVMLRLKP